MEDSFGYTSNRVEKEDETNISDRFPSMIRNSTQGPLSWFDTTITSGGMMDLMGKTLLFWTIFPWLVSVCYSKQNRTVLKYITMNSICVISMQTRYIFQALSHETCHFSRTFLQKHFEGQHQKTVRVTSFRILHKYSPLARNAVSIHLGQGCVNTNYYCDSVWSANF